MPNTLGIASVRSFLLGPLPLFVVAHFAHHLLTALPVPLLPMIRSSFSLDYTQSGLLVSAFSLSYGVGQLPAGWLADRAGARIVITLGLCGAAVAGFLVGLSQTYITMVAALILMGLLAGGYHPSAPALISSSVEPKGLGRALGLHVIGGSASYFLAPLIGVAIATGWGWRGSFIGLAVPTIVFGIVFYIALGRRTREERKTPVSTATRQDAVLAPGRYRRLVVVILLSTCTSAIIVSTITFVPLFIVDHFGGSEKTAAVFLSILFSAGLWAAPLGGHLSDRLGKIPVILAICFVAGPAIYLLNVVPYGVGTVILLLVVGISLSVRMPVTEAYIVNHTSESNRSTVLGVYYFSAMESGGLLTPVFGYLIDRFDFYPTFSLAGAVLVTVTVLSSFWLWGHED